MEIQTTISAAKGGYFNSAVAEMQLHSMGGLNQFSLLMGHRYQKSLRNYREKHTQIQIRTSRPRATTEQVGVVEEYNERYKKDQREMERMQNTLLQLDSLIYDFNI